MTTSEFMDELKKTRRTVEWTLEPDERRALERRACPRYRLRGYLNDSLEESLVFDPIGAVCYRLTGKIHPPESWLEASEAIELSPARAAELVAATNDRTWVGSVGRREPVEYLERLRSRLIAATEAQHPPHAASTRK